MMTLSVMVTVLIIAFLIGFSIVYIFNQDKIHSWLLKDSVKNYEHLINKK